MVLPETERELSQFSQILQRELSQFSQTLQTTKDVDAERTSWVLNAPEPPGFFRELVNSARDIMFPQGDKQKSSGEKPMSKRAISILEGIFPILVWSRNYTATKFKSDLLAGLTLASLCIPQVNNTIFFFFGYWIRNAMYPQKIILIYRDKY